MTPPSPSVSAHPRPDALAGAFHATLTYDPQTLAVLSANADTCALFACPADTLLTRSVTDLPWEDALEWAGGPQTGITDTAAWFRSPTPCHASVRLRRDADTAADAPTAACIERQLLELHDRPLMLVSLRAAPVALLPRSAPSDSVRPLNWEDRERSLIGRLARCLIWYADVSNRADGKLAWEVRIHSEEAADEFLPLRRETGQDYATALYYSRLPEDRERMSRTAQTCVRANQNYSQEYRVRTRDGGVRWLKEDVNIEPVAPGKWRAVGVCTDITERKQAEEAQSHLVRSARCLIWQADVRQIPDGTLAWVVTALSEESAQQFLPLDTPLGTTYWQALTESRLGADRERTDRLGYESVLANQDYSQEYRQRNRWGEVRWLHEDVRVEPVTPGLWHLVGVCSDVTDLKRAQEAQQHVTRSARCLLWHGEVTENADNPEVFDWEVEAISEEVAADFLPLDVSEGSHYMRTMTTNRLPEDEERTWDNARTALRANRNYSQEFRVPDRHGRIWWLREDVSVEPLGPGKWRCVGVCTDVTDLKRAEAEREELLANLRYVASTARCFLWQAMITNRGEHGLGWQMAAPAAENADRLFPIAICPGQNFFDAWYGSRLPEDRYATDRDADKAILAGESFSREFRYLTADGEIRWANEEVAITVMESGQCWQGVGVCVDVTERKRAEEALRELNAQLELRVQERTAQLQAANQEMETFCYSVSHDLRAPLRHINGFSQALLEDYADLLDDLGRDFLRQMCQASKEMAQLIDALLELSRVTRSEMRGEEINLSAMAEDTLLMLRYQDPDRAVDVRIAPHLIVHGDKHLLQATLVNLLGNAWKYTRDAPRAEINFDAIEEDGETVYVVRDNGAGFDMEYADKLFRPFQRLHGSNEFEGTGIGLATVQRIIARHGGRIWAHSAVGCGAEFYFTLPGQCGAAAQQPLHPDALGPA